jgi:metal-dependent amidase/aminoacylase/carboxypeptidase family protein
MPGYENTVPNRVIGELMAANLRQLGLHVATQRRSKGRGSTDFGNVTRRVPGMEMRIAITPKSGVPGHSVEFRAAACSDLGRRAMLNAARGLAMTAIDLLGDADNLSRAKQAFDEDLAASRRG